MPLFALHDSDVRLREQGSFPVSRPRAEELNAQGYGIFWVPNLYRGRRLIKNVEQIRYWFAELDTGTKQEQAEKLRRAPLLPTAVVESARGYHAYWAARGAGLANWKRIVRWGVVPALGADPKATDPLRILRCPGFNHVKDPAKPFPITTVWKLDTTYTEEQMLRLFPDREPKRPDQEAKSLEPGTGSFWQRVAQLDGREAIRRLNGHWSVKGERFELQEQSNGHANIWRTHPDRLSVGCFVDATGGLGSVEGGSSVAAWIKWYGWSWGDVAKAIREVFPEVVPDEQGEARRISDGGVPGLAGDARPL
jgi:hypothetical protein